MMLQYLYIDAGVGQLTVSGLNRKQRPFYLYVSSAHILKLLLLPMKMYPGHCLVSAKQSAELSERSFAAYLVGKGDYESFNAVKGEIFAFSLTVWSRNIKVEFTSFTQGSVRGTENIFWIPRSDLILQKKIFHRYHFRCILPIRPEGEMDVDALQLHLSIYEERHNVFGTIRMVAPPLLQWSARFLDRIYIDSWCFIIIVPLFITWFRYNGYYSPRGNPARNFENHDTQYIILPSYN